MTEARPQHAAVPVLLYHCVGTDPSSWIAPFTVDAATVAGHLDQVRESGRVPLTISQLRDALAGRATLPARPVVVTFDDGYADTLTCAAPLLAERGIPATAYITTGFMGRRSPGGDLMLTWRQLAELADAGFELGAHSVTHPQLDVLPPEQARGEIQDSRAQLEDAIGAGVRSFAYPHGYSSPAVRALVAEAGFDSACSVKNALAGAPDTALTLSRLMVAADTTASDVRGWMTGVRPRVGRRDDRLISMAWRNYRRLRGRRELVRSRL